MTYRLLRDFYLVWVDQIWESEKTKSGIITRNTAAIHTNEEVEDRGTFKRRYGYVMQPPISFSDTTNPDLPIIDPGAPAPRRFVGHDWIQEMCVGGHRAYREDAHLKYYPSTFEQYETMTCADVAKNVDVKIGDKVYFDHKSTDVERYMGPYKEGHIFSVRVDEIICSVKESPIFEGYNKFKQKRIIPQGLWVLVELNMETWETITVNGIIVKQAPEAIPLQGKIVAGRDMNVGQNILFEREADAPITVEGRELTCMWADDVLAELKPLKIKK